MKLNTLFEGTPKENKAEIVEWVRAKCRVEENGYMMRKPKLKEFGIDSQNLTITYFKEVCIFSTESQLPYQFIRCNTFKLYCENLTSCKNFPYEDAYNVSGNNPLYLISGCVKLQYDLFPTTRDNSRLFILKDNGLTMDKIFTNKQLSVNLLSIRYCNSSVLHDMSKWHSIRTTDLYFHVQNKLKNILEVLSISKQHLEYIEFVMNLADNIYYTDDELRIINNLIDKYRNFQNAPEHAMDMTVELIEAGFEDIV